MTFEASCPPAISLLPLGRPCCLSRRCNLCSDDEVGNLLPKTERPCSLYRGTCPGAVEKRIRGIVPPNLDIVGSHFVGGLRYCAPRTTFTTSTHYYSEEAILKPGQSCINEEPMWTNWDMSRQRDHPDTVKDELGLACLDPDDEATCPRARRCEDECATTLCLCFTTLLLLAPPWMDGSRVSRRLAGPTSITTVASDALSRSCSP